MFKKKKKEWPSTSPKRKQQGSYSPLQKFPLPITPPGIPLAIPIKITLWDPSYHIVSHYTHAENSRQHHKVAASMQCTAASIHYRLSSVQAQNKKHGVIKFYKTGIGFKRLEPVLPQSLCYLPNHRQTLTH